jgi:transcription initiation factor TFIID TATA-box-binding protein
MESLTTHPSTAQQARAFTSPASLSFPGGAGDLTPPSSEKEGNMAIGAQGANGTVNGHQQGGNAVNGNGVTPATPAATPGANAPGSGIVPTLQ